jgi:hypothetical protein
LNYIVADPLYLIILLVVFLFRCLPGIFVACLGWLLTGWMMIHKWPQVILRGLLVALAITPTTAGHAGFIPAVWFGGSYLAVQPITAAFGMEPGHTGHLRFRVEFGKEAASLTLGRVLGS